MKLVININEYDFWCHLYKLTRSKKLFSVNWSIWIYTVCILACLLPLVVWLLAAISSCPLAHIRHHKGDALWERRWLGVNYHFIWGRDLMSCCEIWPLNGLLIMINHSEMTPGFHIHSSRLRKTVSISFFRTETHFHFN